MNIGVDFDGTCVTHEFPKIGENIGAVPVLKKIIKSGHNIILNTMRSDICNLQEAIDWFASNGIKLYGINENPRQKSWTTSPKVYADLYIDDAAIGCPLLFDINISTRPYVDWVRIEKALIDCKIIR